MITIFIVITQTCFGQVTIVVESIPNATPPSDTIFLTGNFNNWRTNDPEYILRKQLDGKLAFRFDKPAYTEIEYKFTRGSWVKVESSPSNQYMPNRKLVVTEESPVVYTTIDNWQDLGGAQPISLIAFYYSSVAFLASILLFLIYRTNKKDPVRMKVFTIFNGFMVTVFSAAVVLQVANAIWINHVEMILQVTLFLWGPLVYSFLLGFRKNPFKVKMSWLILPAFGMIVLTVMEIKNLELVNFMNSHWRGLNHGYVGICSAAAINTAICLWLSYKTIFDINPNRKVTNQFTKWFFNLNLLVAILLFGGFCGFAFQIPELMMEDYDPIFVILSALVIVEMYYLWRFPEILSEAPAPSAPIALELKEELEKLMIEEQAFKNPELSKAELSQLLDTKPHVLSKMINDYYGKNFRDYINSYRIMAFIKLAEEGQLERFTFLALAHEVGFNSKSTFNLAFKKYTNESPRDYFKERIRK